jgi:hypothetical protein
MNAFCITKAPIMSGENVRVIVIKSEGSYRGRHLEGAVLENISFKMVGIPFEAIYDDKMDFLAEVSNELNFTMNTVNTILDSDFKDWKTLQKAIHNGDTNIKKNHPNGYDTFLNFLVIKNTVYDYLLELESSFYYNKSKIKNYASLHDEFLKALNIHDKIRKKEGYKRLFRIMGGKSTEEEIFDLSLFHVDMLEETGIRAGFCCDERMPLKLIKNMNYQESVKAFSEIYYIEKHLEMMGLFFVPVYCCNETVDSIETAPFFANLHLNDLMGSLKNHEDYVELDFSVITTLKISKALDFIESWNNVDFKKDVFLREIAVFSSGKSSFNVDFSIDKFEKDSFFDLVKSMIPYNVTKINIIE